MTDFLMRLAERALGVGPVAHPLIPSLHAPDLTLLPPDPPGDDAAAPRPADPPSLESAGEVMLLSPRLATGRELPRPSALEPIGDDPVTGSTPPRSPAAARPAPTRSAPALAPAAELDPISAPATRASVAPVVDTAAPATAPPTARPFTVADLAATGERESSRPSTVPGAATGTEAIEPITGRRSSPSPREERLVVVARPRPESIRRESIRETAPPSPPEPALTRRLPRLEVPPSPGAEAPIVRVTIGRIEVRAATPPAPPAPPTPRSDPALSLDDYLKLRRETAR